MREEEISSDQPLRMPETGWLPRSITEIIPTQEKILNYFTPSISLASCREVS